MRRKTVRFRPVAPFYENFTQKIDMKQEEIDNLRQLLAKAVAVLDRNKAWPKLAHTLAIAESTMWSKEVCDVLRNDTTIE